MMDTRYLEKCDTLFYQGMNSSQAQALKYVGDQVIEATTGELMWCTGRNNLPPLKVIYSLHIGKEIEDVNLQPFSTFTSYLNPINWIGTSITSASNTRNGFVFSPPMNPLTESVAYHMPNISKLSIGQETDINSHIQKYQTWLQRPDKTSGLILYGVSRGTAATFCAFAREKYPEVKLVILEGAIDSVQNILPKRASAIFKSNFMAEKAVNTANSMFSLFTSYKQDGPSPLASIDDYPENIPTVFITSKLDKEVPCENTERIAHELAKRGKNDVYLLKLERSSHPNYMFDDPEDRDNYEAFIHAIYKKYNLKHDPVLAQSGEDLLKENTLLDLNISCELKLN